MNPIQHPPDAPIDPNLDIDISPRTIPKLEHDRFTWPATVAKQEPSDSCQLSNLAPAELMQDVQTTPSVIFSNGLSLSSPNTLAQFIEALRESGRTNGAFGVGQLEEVLGDCLSVPENSISASHGTYPSLDHSTDCFAANTYSSFGIDAALEGRMNAVLYNEHHLTEPNADGFGFSWIPPHAAAGIQYGNCEYPAIPSPQNAIYAGESHALFQPSHLNGWQQPLYHPPVVPLHHQVVPRLSMPNPRIRHPGGSPSQNLDSTMLPWRRHRQKLPKCDPTMVYTDLSAPPSWGPMTESGQVLFRYDKGGTLDTSILVNKSQLELFINQCPRSLMIWVQQAPAQCNYRLGKGESKCRYLHCPDPKRTILPGWLRVAMDEYPELVNSGIKDPYKMSMVLHLWCFERCVDPLELYRKGNFAADQRQLPMEMRNSMAINKDTDTMIVPGAFDPWFIKNESERRLHGQRTARREYKDSLSFTLVNYHLSNQIQSRQKTRNCRNRTKLRSNLITIDIHKGDLEMYISHRQTRARVHNRPIPKHESLDFGSRMATASSSLHSGSTDSELQMSIQESIVFDTRPMPPSSKELIISGCPKQSGTQEPNGVQPSCGHRYPKRERL